MRLWSVCVLSFLLLNYVAGVQEISYEYYVTGGHPTSYNQ